MASASPAGASEMHLPLLSSVGPRPAPPSVRGWGPTWEGPVGPWARLPLPAAVVAVLVSSTVTKSRMPCTDAGAGSRAAYEKGGIEGEAVTSKYVTSRVRSSEQKTSGVS